MSRFLGENVYDIDQRTTLASEASSGIVTAVLPDSSGP